MTNTSWFSRASRSRRRSSSTDRLSSKAVGPALPPSLQLHSRVLHSRVASGSSTPSDAPTLKQRGANLASTVTVTRRGAFVKTISILLALSKPHLLCSLFTFQACAFLHAIARVPPVCACIQIDEQAVVLVRPERAQDQSSPT
jgi:hypothetical protein